MDNGNFSATISADHEQAVKKLCIEWQIKGDQSYKNNLQPSQNCLKCYWETISSFFQSDTHFFNRLFALTTLITYLRLAAYVLGETNKSCSMMLQWVLL